MKFALGRGIDSSDEEHSARNKKLLIGSGVIAGFIVVAGGTYIVARKGTTKPSSNLATTIEVKREACKLFTLDDAKKILGNKASPSSTNANAVSNSVSTSLCSYSSNDTDANKLKVVTVLVRSTNPVQARQAFEVSKAANAIDVKDFAQSAYYNPDVSQLNILNNELLIRIAATEGTGGKGTIETPKKVGEVITSRL